MADTYWAALTDPREVVRELMERRKRYVDTLRRVGRESRAIIALRAYYGRGANGQSSTSELGVSGERGEFTEMAVAEFAGLVDQSVAQLLAAKPAYQAIAKAGDYDAMSQAEFADSLLDSLDRDSGVEDMEDEATKLGLLTGDAWVVSSWDATAGEALGLDGSKVAYAGDVRLDVCTAWDVIWDTSVRHMQHLRWLAWSRPVSRWDVIAEVQPKEGEDAESLERRAILIDRLKAAQPDNSFEADRVRAWLDGRRDADTEDGDNIVVWEFRHPPSPALPQGRLIRFVDDATVIQDTATAGYPYEALHADRFEPSKVVATPHGWTPAFDLLGYQEAMDSVATMMATAAAASGVSNVWCPPGANLTVSALNGGLNLVESTTKPEPLLAVQVDPQAVAFLEACRSWAQRRMGLNDVSLGDATRGMPAQLAALLDAKAVQFWNTAVKSLSQMRARLRTSILGIFKRYASAPRTAVLAGKNNQWALDEWEKSKLQLVSRVAVEPVSAASKTLSGKMATADLLMERGLINTADEYLQVKSTGRLEKLTEFKDRNLLRIQQQKEMLQRGVGLPPVDVAATDEARMVDPEAPVVYLPVEGEFIRPTVVDTPWLDIAEWAAVLAAPNARNNAAVVKATTEAIQASIETWRTMPPEVIAALGGYPPPAGIPGVPMAGDAGGDMGEQMPAPGGEAPEGVRRIAPPKPPPNPLTGEQPPAASDVSQPV